MSESVKFCLNRETAERIRKEQRRSAPDHGEKFGFAYYADAERVRLREL